MGASIRLEHVTVEYESRDGLITALDDASLDVEPGSVVAMQGPSGSGKSTMLNVICGLVRPKSGSVWLDSQRVDGMSQIESCALRLGRIGFVFQAFHLLGHLTAVENVALGARLAGADPAEANGRAREALSEVGLVHRASHRPAELSGGEQQRVAVARAIAAMPSLLLADEPTGNLDPAASELVTQLLIRVRDITGATVVVATHAKAVAEAADRVWDLTRPANRAPLHPHESASSTHAVSTPGMP